MLRKLSALAVLMFCCSFFAAAQTVKVGGIVKDAQGKPIDVVNVSVLNSNLGTNTNRDGRYLLEVPADTQLTIIFSYTGYQTERRRISTKKGQYELMPDITLKADANTLKEVIVSDINRGEAGSTTIDISKANIMVSPTGGIEAIIKTLVGSNNELTSQYNVRGGNYDENLVYVNDFEIYRPFLVRSGQQEGLSFVNPDLASGVNFSVGGFQAKYGDKMSSVLDVTYKRPKQFGGSVMASLLGASLHLEGASKNERLTYLIGAREKSNQYLLQSRSQQKGYTTHPSQIYRH